MAEQERHDTDSVQLTVKNLIDDAADHYTNYIQPDQVEATELYFGHRVETSYGDLRKVAGRSGAVSTDVRDAVFHMMPSVMRVLMGSDRVVEFVPIGPDDVELAELQTDIVNYVIRKDNKGFRAVYSACMDGLVRRIGWVKWWWDEGTAERRGLEYSGLSQMQLMKLNMDEAVLNIDVTARYDDEETGEELYDAAVIRRGMPKVRIQEVPPEEVFYTRGSVSLDDAACVAHVREMPADEVVAMGYDMELVDGYKDTTNATQGATDGSASLRRARHFVDGATYESNLHDSVDESQRPVLFAEAYAKVDVDGDGIAELRLFHCLGESYDIVNGDGFGEVVDEIPFARFSPFLEPHTSSGLSIADLVGDVQVKKSLIERGLDHSLSRSIDPQMVVNEHAVNVADLQNTHLNRYIRTRGDVNNAIREIPLQFLGAEALAVLEWYNEKRADRVGMTRAAEGLDPSALQSSTAEAVAGTFSKSAEIKEMVSRVLAETGMKDLFKGVLRTIQRNQDFVRQLRMDDGRFVEMNPETWDIERDVEINIGEANTDRKVQGLMAILGEQKDLLANGSPLVSFVEVGNTLRRLSKALDYRNATEFFRPFSPEDQQQWEQMMAAQQRPSPEEQLVGVEQAKVMLQDLRERDKMALDASLKEAELEAKYKMTLDNTALKGKFDMAKQRMADETDVEVAEIGARARAQSGGD